MREPFPISSLSDSPRRCLHERARGNRGTCTRHELRRLSEDLFPSSLHSTFVSVQAKKKEKKKNHRSAFVNIIATLRLLQTRPEMNEVSVRVSDENKQRRLFFPPPLRKLGKFVTRPLFSATCILRLAPRSSEKVAGCVPVRASCAGSLPGSPVSFHRADCFGFASTFQELLQAFQPMTHGIKCNAFKPQGPKSCAIELPSGLEKQGRVGLNPRDLR